jgi:hypothetical protein
MTWKRLLHKRKLPLTLHFWIKGRQSAKLFVIIVSVMATMLVIALATPDPNHLGVDDKEGLIVQ